MLEQIRQIGYVHADETTIDALGLIELDHVEADRHLHRHCLFHSRICRTEPTQIDLKELVNLERPADDLKINDRLRTPVLLQVVRCRNTKVTGYSDLFLPERKGFVKKRF